MKKKKRTAYTFVSFLFLSVSLLCSSTIYAQNSTVNLNYKDASFVEVINEFRKQTGVKFMYNLETKDVKTSLLKTSLRNKLLTLY